MRRYRKNLCNTEKNAERRSFFRKSFVFPQETHSFVENFLFATPSFTRLCAFLMVSYIGGDIMEEQEFISTGELPKATAQEREIAGGKAKAVVKFINVSEIMPDPQKTPKFFKTEDLARLALDILENGLRNHLALLCYIYKGKEKYRLLSGEKRFRACLLARITRVPCTVIYPIDTKKTTQELIMPPRDYFEEARIFAEAINRGLYTEQEIANKAGVKQEDVHSTLSLLVFSEKEQQILKDYCIPCNIAQKLALMDIHTRKGFLESITHGTNIAAVCAKISEASTMPSSQRTKFRINNTGFFFNSVNHAVETMREGGVDIHCDTKETDISTIMTLTVPKGDNVPRGT